MSIFTEVFSDSIHSKFIVEYSWLQNICEKQHCVKSVRFRRFFGPYSDRTYRLEKQFSLSATSLTTQKMKFSIKNFFSKFDQIRWSHLQTKSLKENFFFCATSGNMLNMFRVDNTETKTNAEYGYEQFVKIPCILFFFWLS